jgi:DNA-binding CsgD family transcriptional regulator
VITGYDDRAANNRAYAAGACLICKPVGLAELEVFSRDVLAFDVGLDGRLRAATLSIASEAGVTFAETETLALAVLHVSANEIMKRRCVTRNTYKTQLLAIREKLGVTSLEEACARVLAVSGR